MLSAPYLEHFIVAMVLLALPAGFVGHVFRADRTIEREVIDAARRLRDQRRL